MKQPSVGLIGLGAMGGGMAQSRIDPGVPWCHAAAVSALGRSKALTPQRQQRGSF